MASTAAYDVGGAHLKAALAQGGRVTAARQIACPLWLGLDRLTAAFDIASELTGAADRHVFTMTGELCDIFANRQEGVRALLAEIGARFGDRAIIWAGRRGLVPLAEAAPLWADIASANFLATATAVGHIRSDALMIDMGSTTVDLIAIRAGRPACRGFSDADRLASGELVYTGLTRTPLMAIAGRAPFKGVWQGLAREYFATAADMRRVIGDLPEGIDQHATADGREAGVPESVARLARMFGRDAADGSLDDWRIAARYLAERQMRLLIDAAAQILSASGLPSDAPVVAAGIGANVVAEAARRLGRLAEPIADLLDCAEDARLWAGRCAPAMALAWLANQQV